MNADILLQPFTPPEEMFADPGESMLDASHRGGGGDTARRRGTAPTLKARQTADRLVLGSGYPDTGLVVGDRLGRPVRPAGYSDRFALLCRDAGVRKVHLHAVRHTLATIMNRAGVPPVDAAALLGHTVAVYLARYVTSTEKGARTAASGLGAAISAVR
jgi:integrase